MAQLRDGLKYDLLGDKELNNFFHDTLKFGQQKSVMLSAYRKAAKPLINTAKSNLRTRLKNKNRKTLLKSIGVKPSRARVPQLLVGTRIFGNWKGNAGHLVDKGTGIRKSKKGNRGRMPGNKFWSDAVKSETITIKHLMSDELLISLKKLVDRNLKRMNKAS